MVGGGSIPDYEEDAPEPEIPKHSVLVVDDEEAITALLARALTYAGFDVSTAATGPIALQLLGNKHFDVMLTDLNMPRMNGLELQRSALEMDSQLVVFIITAAQDVRLAVECLQDGAYDYVTKPFDMGDIASRIEAAIQKRVRKQEKDLYDQDLQRRVDEHARNMRHVFLSSFKALAIALDAKSSHTQDHSARVASIATNLAIRIKPLDTDFRDIVLLAAQFHDIGKIAVPESILNKPGPLTAEEFDIVKQHSVIGENILRPIAEENEEILAVVRHHHERWDGTGYPDGLRGEDIPLGARILGVVDAYDAMTSNRPYRPSLSRERSLQLLLDGAGSQWDPNVVAGFVSLLDEGLFDSPNYYKTYRGTNLDMVYRMWDDRASA
jgi:putative nucleotidyltransferase with HDIG domain